MKLLLDQNLSWRLVKALQGLFAESAHVRDLALDRAADADVWEYARREGFVIISKDSDFEQRSLLHGHPPKCIWLRVGNCSTREIEDLLHRHVEAIRSFVEAEGESYMILS
jgi:predicted nuclease of predicted toxin-antitoxin system